jgi:hypothetical protein
MGDSSDTSSSGGFSSGSDSWSGSGSESEHLTEAQLFQLLPGRQYAPQRANILRLHTALTIGPVIARKHAQKAFDEALELALRQQTHSIANAGTGETSVVPDASTEKRQQLGSVERRKILESAERRKPPRAPTPTPINAPINNTPNPRSGVFPFVRRLCRSVAALLEGEAEDSNEGEQFILIFARHFLQPHIIILCTIYIIFECNVGCLSDIRGREAERGAEAALTQGRVLLESTGKVRSWLHSLAAPMELEKVELSAALAAGWRKLLMWAFSGESDDQTTPATSMSADVPVARVSSAPEPVDNFDKWAEEEPTITKPADDSDMPATEVPSTTEPVDEFDMPAAEVPSTTEHVDEFDMPAAEVPSTPDPTDEASKDWMDDLIWSAWLLIKTFALALAMKLGQLASEAVGGGTEATEEKAACNARSARKKGKRRAQGK